MSIATIRTLLAEDLQKTALLVELLGEEKQQLEQRELEALSSILHRKAQLLATIEASSTACQQFLAEAGFAGDRQGLLDCCQEVDRIEAQGSDASAQSRASAVALFEQLQQNLQHCRDLNLVNAAIVHRSKLNTGKLLDILRGKTDSNTLYNPVGDTSNHGESRPLGSA